MSIWNWMVQNSELLWMLAVVLLNLPALVFHVIRVFRTGRAGEARAWAEILEEASILQAEAEGFPDWGAAERLCYVLTRLQRLCAALGVTYDEELLIAHLTACEGKSHTSASPENDPIEGDKSQ